MSDNFSSTTPKRFIAVDGSARALLLVRGHLLRAVMRAGHEVIACAAIDTSAHDIQVDNLEAKYQANGIRLYKLDMQRQGMNPLADLRVFIQLWRLMRQLHPDVVLSYSAKSSLYGSVAARLAGVPNIYSAITGLGYLFTDDMSKQYVKAIVQRLWGVALALNTQVFFQNPDDRDLFLKAGLLRKKEFSLIVNGSGVDLNYFVQTPLPSGPITFLMVARVQYQKGVIEYLQAARILKNQYPQIKFQLLGPSDDHPSTISSTELDKWRQDGTIEFLGGTPDVRPFLERCHVFVLPSYREGAPRSTLEAMAVGRPIVTTDVPGCRETVVDGDNGFLVPVKNPAALAEAMKHFLEAPNLIASMGRRSRQIAEEKYDVNKVVAVMMRAMNL